LSSTYETIVSVIVDTVVCAVVDTVVRSVNEETVVTELVVVSVVVVTKLWMMVAQVGCASIHMHTVLMTPVASALSCDRRLSRLEEGAEDKEDDAVVIAWDEDDATVVLAWDEEMDVTVVARVVDVGRPLFVEMLLLVPFDDVVEDGLLEGEGAGSRAGGGGGGGGGGAGDDGAGGGPGACLLSSAGEASTVTVLV
jgi:uncharacterized membrane protein YgcG